MLAVRVLGREPVGAGPTGAQRGGALVRKQEQPGYRQIRKAGTHLAPIQEMSSVIPCLSLSHTPCSALILSSAQHHQDQHRHSPREEQQAGEETEALGKGLTHLTPASSGNN